ncbi:MAG: ATP-binding protein [Pelobium sp.]
MKNHTLNKDEITNLLDESYACRTYDLKRSILLTNKALAASKVIEDPVLTGKSLNQLSLFYMINGANKKAMSMAKEAIKIFKGLGDEKGVADGLYSIAGIYYKSDNYHQGLINLIDCLRIYTNYKDYFNQARVYKSLGTIYEYFGDQKNAIDAYQQSIKAAKKIKNEDLISNVYNSLSGICLKENKVKKATELVEKSILMKKRTGDLRGLAFAIYGRAKVYMHEGEYELAENNLKHSIDMHIQTDEKLGLGMAYHKLGQLYFLWEKLEEAKAILNAAITVGTSYNIMMISFKSNFLLYEIAKTENHPEQALKFLELYLSQKEKVINVQTLHIIESYNLITKMQLLEKDNELKIETAKILEKRDKAEQRARVKQDFLSTMSHEIRTPLNAITTISALLGDKFSGDDKNLIDSLNAASKNLMLIINDILDFTKLDNGKVTLDLRPCDLKLTLNRLINTYKLQADEKDIKLTLAIDQDLSDCYQLDETKLSQILNNLISNGIKFTNSGSVNVKVKKIKNDTLYDHVCFEVKDTGSGISNDYYEEMFESFAQPKSITTKKHGGTGLGLAIVKKIVNVYGSNIKFKSKVGKGTQFYFTLKLKREANIEAPKIIVENLLKGKHALLSEDNQINSMVAIRLLSKWGIKTDLAVNGIEAVEKANAKVYDFILMDIHMPEMNGFDATKLIKLNSNPNQNTPIFALTADITAESMKEYKIYFEGFLRKPIEIEKLYENLINAIT